MDSPTKAAATPEGGLLACSGEPEPPSPSQAGSSSCRSSQDRGAPLVTSVLRLRGLPFTATAEDVEDFFSGYAVKEVLICKRHGRAYGQALVVLDSLDAAKAAFSSLHKKSMGTRYIEIFNATDKDVEMVKALADDARRQGFVVRLRGLPFNISAAEIAAWLEPVKLDGGVDSVHLTFNTVGRPTGEAYVELPEEDAMQATMRKHKEVLGPRYVEVFSSTRNEMAQALQQSVYNRRQAEFGAQRTFADTGYAAGGDQHAAGMGVVGAGVGMAELTGAFQGFYLNPGSAAASQPYQTPLVGYQQPGVRQQDMQLHPAVTAAMGLVPAMRLQQPMGLTEGAPAGAGGHHHQQQQQQQQQYALLHGGYVPPIQQGGLYGMPASMGIPGRGDPRSHWHGPRALHAAGTYMPGYGMAPAGTFMASDGQLLQHAGAFGSGLITTCDGM